VPVVFLHSVLSSYANVVYSWLYLCYDCSPVIMDCDAVSVPPMSPHALVALQSLPTGFTNTLNIPQRQDITDAFARVDFLAKGTIQPKVFQLKCLISLLASRPVVVRAATGAGKTLAMMLPLLLSPDKMASTVTPLKLLQKD
jgi:hypothetical protein